MTGPGALNRRLTLEAPVEADDGTGGVTRSYAAVATLWAQVTPLGAQAAVAAGRLEDAQRIAITIRAGQVVTIFHRLREGARVFCVVAVRESADRRFTEIVAQEQKD